jgi:hypothetical protein
MSGWENKVLIADSKVRSQNEQKGTKIRVEN